LPGLAATVFYSVQAPAIACLIADNAAPALAPSRPAVAKTEAYRFVIHS
jgi:hypothetical protein